MNDLLLRGFLIVLGYLAGSIPVGVLVARASGGPDPRTIGSGRTGGTNALRALGRKWAAMVVAGDLANAFPSHFGIKGQRFATEAAGRGDTFGR